MLINIVKLIAVLAAALVVGNSFLAELKKARALGLPWYKPYLTLPGILILIAIFVVPVILKIMHGS
jgi:TRAP-type C4-dicarboxylate transport system permease small subunit